MGTCFVFATTFYLGTPLEQKFLDQSAGKLMGMIGRRLQKGEVLTYKFPLRKIGKFSLTIEFCGCLKVRFKIRNNKVLERTICSEKASFHKESFYISHRDASSIYVYIEAEDLLEILSIEFEDHPLDDNGNGLADVFEDVVRLKSAERLCLAMQTYADYTPYYDTNSDVLWLYMSNILDDYISKYDNWKRKGGFKHIWGMASVSHDWNYTGAPFVLGKWDGVKHFDYLQRNQEGKPVLMLTPGSTDPNDVWAYYIVPYGKWRQYLKDMVRKMLEAGVEAVILEEPEYWKAAGYSELFKQIYEKFYNEPWEDPKSSSEARFKVEYLKAKLYADTYEEVFSYVKQIKPSVKTYVTPHSFINYTAWGCSLPYWDLFTSPHIDGVIWLMWTGTYRTPIKWRGKLRELFFENAYAECSYAATMREICPNKDIWFFHDTREDVPGYSWEDYERWWEEGVIAELMFPNINKWLHMVWPERNLGKLPGYLMPYSYRSQWLIMSQVLKEISTYTKSWRPQIGILVTDEMMYELDTRSSVDYFYGIFLPLLYEGYEIASVPLEAFAEGYGIPDSLKVLLLPKNFKIVAKAERALIEWIKQGGVLITFGWTKFFPKAVKLKAEQGWVLDLGTLIDFRDPDISSVPTSFSPNTPEEQLFLYKDFGTGGKENCRFADGEAYFIYYFPTNGMHDFKIRVFIGNNYLIEASTDAVHWEKLIDSSEKGVEITDLSNQSWVYLDLSCFLPAPGIFLKFSDPFKHDGWGPYLTKVDLISLRNKTINLPVNFIPCSYEVYKYNNKIFEERVVGKGKVVFVGFPASLFANSEQGPELLMDFLKPYLKGIPRSYIRKRGPYTIVFCPPGKQIVIPGRYLDMLNCNMPLVENPIVDFEKKIGLFRDPPKILFVGSRPLLLDEFHKVAVLSGPLDSFSVIRFLEPVSGVKLINAFGEKVNPSFFDLRKGIVKVENFPEGVLMQW